MTHLALLLGIGVSAVNPWFAFATVADMADNRELSTDLPVATAAENYVRDILDRWEQERARFVKVFPMEYRRALGEMPGANARRNSPKGGFTEVLHIRNDA